MFGRRKTTTPPSSGNVSDASQTAEALVPHIYRYLEALKKRRQMGHSVVRVGGVNFHIGDESPNVCIVSANGLALVLLSRYFEEHGYRTHMELTISTRKPSDPDTVLLIAARG